MNSHGVGILQMMETASKYLPKLQNRNFFRQSVYGAFQRLFGLEVDGAVGPATWYALVGISDGAQAGRLNPVRIPYNTTYRAGSSGDGVRILQGLLNTVARATGFAAPVAVDGRYGAATRSLVTAFQRSIGITADGIVGRVTWDALVEAFNLVIQTA